jgi:serine/threonine protein kinase
VSAIPLQRLEGKYEILEKIREGGMGAIYKVRHRLLDEVRVIKLMRPQFTEDEELKARFLREAQLAIKLRHPNIAQLYDFTVDEESGTAFIVMEFIQGTTLEDLLADHGPPPLGLALEIARQSLRALGYLHTKGFIHRDISPDNLMLTEDAEGSAAVKLIDLGIAKILGAAGEKSLTQAGTFLGKVRYASPEQFGSEGAGQADIRGDLYSFGLVLYELLTGRYPIQGRDPSSIIAGHLFRPPLDFAESDPAGRIPEGLREVVLKALAKSPADRYATGQEMSRALAPFRQPDDVPEADLRRMLSAPVATVREEPVPAAGSTQARLDEQFGLETTPLPRHLEALTPGTGTAALTPSVPAAPVRSVDPGLDDTTGRLFQVDEAGRRHQEAASTDEAVPLEEQREKLVEERRAAKLEAAVAEIRACLDAGSLDEATRLLDRGVVRFGGTVSLREQWERLEVLRKAERAAREHRKREGELQVAKAVLESLLDRRELDEAAKLLDETATGYGETGDVSHLRDRLARLRQDQEARKAADAPLVSQPTRPDDPDFEHVWEATRRIAELVAQRDTHRALQELREATARFGEREEIQKLRKRLADMVLEG